MPPESYLVETKAVGFFLFIVFYSQLSINFNATPLGKQSFKSAYSFEIWDSEIYIPFQQKAEKL